MDGTKTTEINELKKELEILTARLNSRVAKEHVARTQQMAQTERLLSKQVANLERKINTELNVTRAKRKETESEIVGLENILSEAMTEHVQTDLNIACDSDEKTIRDNFVHYRNSGHTSKTKKVVVQLNELDKKDKSLTNKIEKICKEINSKFDVKIDREEAARKKGIDTIRRRFNLAFSELERTWFDIIEHEKAQIVMLKSYLVAVQSLLERISKKQDARKISNAKEHMSKSADLFLETRVSNSETVLLRRATSDSNANVVGIGSFGVSHSDVLDQVEVSTSCIQGPLDVSAVGLIKNMEIQQDKGKSESRNFSVSSTQTVKKIGLIQSGNPSTLRNDSEKSGCWNWDKYRVDKQHAIDAAAAIPADDHTPVTSCSDNDVIMAAPDKQYLLNNGSVQVVDLQHKNGTAEVENKLLYIHLHDRILKDKIEWSIKKRKPTATELNFHSGIFYTSKPGYRVQLRAQIDRLHGDVYFSVRLLKGVFDDQLLWPFPLVFCVRLSDKIKKNIEKHDWIFPHSRQWKKDLNQPEYKKGGMFSEWCGPFNLSSYLDLKTLYFDISLA